MPGSVFLSDDRVSLHPIETDDEAFCRALLNEPRVRTSIGSTDPITAHDEREWIESQGERDGWHFLVCERPDAGTDGADDADAVRLGTIGVTPTNDVWGTAEIGYSIHPDHWNEGHATAAVELVCRYAFDERRLAKLFAKTYATNPASGRVLEKNGFEREGTLREEAFVAGERVDVVRYGLLAGAWREQGGQSD
ncbi:GNAT family N-acetyltransferase [Halovivax limisalsi]|uniref:GNAT family N-acetyltransferase n=1 Tax=Halovivax limisalsi TaxID=1453760 RepID=UPI001FFD9485|nr:GNAT family protein [Halovivax limisalsi]